MIITLCGSAKFESVFHMYNEKLSLAQHIVLSLAVYPYVKGLKHWYTDEQKEKLDKVHKLKISISDAIVVLNVGGYIGESTKSEIEFAEYYNKPIYYLEPLHEHCLVVQELL